MLNLNFVLLFRLNSKVYLLGYGAKLFRFDFGEERNVDENQQQRDKKEEGLCLQENTNGQPGNYLFLVCKPKSIGIAQSGASERKFHYR